MELSNPVLEKVFEQPYLDDIIGTYSLHFCMDARTNHSRVEDHAIIRGLDILPNEHSVRINDCMSHFYHVKFLAAFFTNLGASVMLRFTPFDAGEVAFVRMGMSFISPDQACSNAEEEIPTFDFDAVSQSSISEFENILNRIRVNNTDVSDETMTLFYSSV